MFTISCPPKVIWLGRKGENEFRTIEVEASEWLRDYPNGTISVVYHRPDGAIYLPTVTTSGNVTSWLITATDTAIAGKGEVEYRIIDGDIIGKSVKMPTMVSAAINATTDSPAPPPEDWTAVAAEILGMIGDLDNLDTEAKNNLVAAINEAFNSGGGGSADTQWNGKTAIFFGDSLTEQNQHYTKGYHSWIKDILGLTSYVNKGQSGKNLAGIYNQIYGTTETADLICVMGGVNDQTASVPLGQMGDTGLTTTYGCVYNICNLINSKFPTSRKLFITPHFQTKYPHSGGITSYEISKAIKEVCEKYSVAVYDNFVMSEIRTDNLSTFTVDNCHWNDRGHEMVGKNISKWLLDKFRYVYTGVQPTPIAVTGVTLNKNSTTITEGSAETLTATVAPANATNKSVVWSTSNSTIATVNNGVVTAVSDGNATITVTTVDGGFTATCAVTVEAGTIVVTGITLNKATTTITEGAIETLVATLQPAGASGTITWVSSDDTKATVANGVVTAVAEGNATITASCEGFSASCVVTVEAAVPVEITVTPIANTCNATFADGTLTLSNKTQTFYGVDFNNCTKLTATSVPSGNHWIAAKRSNGTYCGFMLVTQNQQGLLYTNITPTLSNFGAGQTLIDSSEPPITGVTSSVEVQIVGGALVIKIDGTVINTKITDTSFVALAYTTSAANTWSGLTLE